MTQQALPLEVPITEREYHAFEGYGAVLCKRCHRVLWAPVHGLAPGEIEAIQGRLEVSR